MSSRETNEFWKPTKEVRKAISRGNKKLRDREKLAAATPLHPRNVP